LTTKLIHTEAAGVIEAVIQAKANTDGLFAIAYAILKLAEAQQGTAECLNSLSRTDGAVEFLASQVGAVAEAVSGLAVGQDGHHG
jgi:hypothetical protein